MVDTLLPSLFLCFQKSVSGTSPDVICAPGGLGDASIHILGLTEEACSHYCILVCG